VPTLDWKAIVALFVAPTTVLAVAGFAVKTVADHVISARFDESLEKLKAQQDRELEAFKGLLAENAQVHAEARAATRERDARVRAVLAQVAPATLDAINALSARLDNILRQELYNALQPGFTRVAGWSMTHAYARDSTQFAFARFFAARVRLCAFLGDEEFKQDGQREAFVGKLYAATKPLSDWPFAPSSPADSTDDAQLFFQDQDAIGAMLIDRADKAIRTLDYAEFLLKAHDSKQVELGRALANLDAVLRAARPNSVAWRRLEALQRNFEDLRMACTEVLRTP